MRKFYELLILIFLAIFAKSLGAEPLKDGTLYTIDEMIEGTDEYRTKTVSFSIADSIHYLKYDFTSSVPSSLVTAFKIDITAFSFKMGVYKVFCANFLSTISDNDLIAQLANILVDESKSTCFDIYQSEGTLLSLMKLDSTKTKIGIAIYIPPAFFTDVKINLRIPSLKNYEIY